MKYKYIIIFCLLSLAYFFYAYFILSPHLYKHFSLIDDGQTIQNSFYFEECFKEHKCENLKSVLIEKQFGRFRSGYWFIQYTFQEILGLNAQLQHEIRVYLLGYVLFSLLLISIANTGGNFLSLILGSAVFVSSFSFTENITRLGPVESYQLFFFAIFSLLYLNQKVFSDKKILNLIIQIIMVMLLVFLVLIKETSIVIVFGIIFLNLIYKNQKIKALAPQVIIPFLVFLIGRYLSRSSPTEIYYIENYSFNPLLLMKNAIRYIYLISNSMSPFFILFIFSLFLFLVEKKIRSFIFNEKYLYWLIMFFLFTTVLIPWKFVLDRYLLLSIFSFSIVSSIAFTKLITFIENEVNIQKYTRGLISYLYWMGLFFIISNLFFINAPTNLAKAINYKNWYSTFLKFESEQVLALSKTRDGEIYINAIDNLNNWEVLFEIPIHLKYINHSPVVVKTPGEKLPNEGYLFTRSSMDLALSEKEIIDKNFSLIASQKYEIDQIDPFLFGKEFWRRPIRTLLAPPFEKGLIKYYWEIRQL